MYAKESYKQWKQFKREICAAVNKGEGVGNLRSPLTSDMEMQFGVCPAGFPSCFGPMFPYYAPFPPTGLYV